MSKRERLLLAGSFLIPFSILIVLWLILDVAPFGGKNLLASDLGSQYLPFLNDFKRFVEEGNRTFYDFSNGIGDTIFPLSSYYLLSPFNLLALLFPYEKLPIAIVWIITLKVSCIGGSMFYYLKKTYADVSAFTWIFSTAFSLCGFTAAYSLNFMWLDALILFPLLTLGLQRVWQKKRVTLYVITLFLAIFTNYYMGYMICIFAVGYSIYLYVKQNAGPSVLGFIKEGRDFFIASILSGLSTSFILLPALEGMLQTKKTAFDLLTFVPYPKFGLSFLSQLGLGTVDFNIRLDHLPTVFSGILITLLFLAYFTLPTVPKKEKLLTFYLVLLLFLSFWIELLNTVWHMFQSPAGFPYRNTFIFSFILIKFAYEAFLRLGEGKGIPVTAPFIYTLGLLSGYAALTWFNAEAILSYAYLLISLLLIWFYFFLFNHKKISKSLKKTQLISGLLLITVFTELGANYWISLKEVPFGNQQQYEVSYKNQEEALASIENTDLARIKQVVRSEDGGYAEKNNGYNNSILFGYPGISSYTSTLHSGTQDTLQALGLFQKNDRRIAYVDDSQVVNFLLNVTHQVTPHKSSFREPLSTFNQTFVYQNTEAIGLGFLVPQAFAKIKLTQKAPVATQEKVLQAIQKQEDSYFANAAISEEQSSEDQRDYSLNATAAADGDLYFYLPRIAWSSVKEFSVNGVPVKPSVNIKTNQLFNLGHFTKGEKVAIQLRSKKKINTADMELASLNQLLFDRLTTTKNKEALDLRWTKKGELFGNISVKEEEQLLYLAIPFDENWSIKVNGERVQQIQVAGNLMAVPLKKGTCSIALVYRSMSFYYGGLITLATILGFLIFRYWLFIKKKRELHKC